MEKITLREYLINKGISHSEIAEEIGCSRNIITSVVWGKQRLTGKLLNYFKSKDKDFVNNVLLEKYEVSYKEGYLALTPEIENNQINKYNILVGKMDEQGCGDLNTVFTTFNKKRAYEAFKNQIVTEKNDINKWHLERKGYLEIHLEQAIYDLEEEEEIETEDGPDILEIEKIRK